MASGDTKTESYLRAAAEGTRADLPSDTCCNTKTQNLILGVAERIMDVEDEVEELKNNPDVVDIVDTYQDLQAYDTSTLTDKDIIRVLEDSTHNNNSTFYRWNASTNQFDYIGEVSGGVNVVQTIGTSTTDVMSQKAVTDELFNGANRNKIQIGNGALSTGNSYYESIAIGRSTQATGQNSTAIGSYRAFATADSSTAIGRAAESKYKGSVALGAFSAPSAIGEADIGSTETSYGYNNTNYRLLTGLYDPQNAHDAATKGYVDANAGSITNFYVSGSDIDMNEQVYKDEDCTIAATGNDVAAAYRDGTARIIATESNAVADIVYIDAANRPFIFSPIHYSAYYSLYVDSDGILANFDS